MSLSFSSHRLLPGVLIATFVLSACGSGTQQTVPIARNGAQIPLAGVAAQNIHVSSYSPRIITFAANSSGNVAPQAFIQGPNTGLTTNVFQIAVNSQGTTFATNDSIPGKVLMYAPGSQTSPTATLSVPAFPIGVALDVNENIYAFGGSNGTGAFVAWYPKGASGNTAPIGVIAGSKTGLDVPTGLAFDSAGNLYVANQQVGNVLIFSKGSSGNVAPIQTISLGGGVIPLGIAVDSANRFYVSVSGVAEIRVYGGACPTLLYRITSSEAGDPRGLAFDSSGNLYVVNFPNEIVVYGPGAHGSTKPIAIIAGAQTDLSQALGVAIGP